MAVTEELPWIYGAALAASATEDAAVQATARALGEGPAPRAELIARAIRAALRTAPAPPFDVLEPAAAEALALVRLAGMDVDTVAATVGVPPGEVKLRLAAALRDLRGGSEPRRPPPPLGCAS